MQIKSPSILKLLAVLTIVGSLASIAAVTSTPTSILSPAVALTTFVEVGNATLQVDGNSSVDIWVRDFPEGQYGLGAYAIRVDYDQTKVNITSVSPGNNPFNSPTSNIYSDHVEIAQFSTAWPGPTGDIKIASLQFTCQGAGVTTLTLTIETLANVNGDNISATPVDGTITQGSPTATPTPTTTPTPSPTPTPTPTPAPGGSTPVIGITREVDGSVLAGVTVTLDGAAPVWSDQDGQYEIMATSTGSHTVVAHKTGFRDRTQIVNISGLGQGYAVTCNFQGMQGLFPSAPDMGYVLDCVNHWLYPPNPERALDILTVLDVINAWLYPVQ